MKRICNECHKEVTGDYCESCLNEHILKVRAPHTEVIYIAMFMTGVVLVALAFLLYTLNQ